MVVGVGGDLLIANAVLKPEQWRRKALIVAMSSVGIVAQSLYNEATGKSQQSVPRETRRLVPIKDQFQYRKAEQDLNQLKLVLKLASLYPFWSRERQKWLKGQRRKLHELEEQLKRYRDLPDRFNALFQPVGWIASEDLSVDLMERAVTIFDQDGREPAEVLIEEHFNTILRQWLNMLCFLPIVRPRRDILFLALTDHEEQRFHASTPVVLAQIDGIVIDVYGRGFFETKQKNTKHLRATESIVGDESGLPSLSLLLGEVRTKTQTAAIDLPFRNGIMHGRDLGYATRRVSTKAFAALLSLRPLIIKAQRGEQYQEPPLDSLEPKPFSWEETRQQFSELVATVRDYGLRRERREELMRTTEILGAEDRRLADEMALAYGPIDYQQATAFLISRLQERGFSEVGRLPKEVSGGQVRIDVTARNSQEAWFNIWIDYSNAELKAVMGYVYPYLAQLLCALQQIDTLHTCFALSCHIRNRQTQTRNSLFLRVNKRELDCLSPHFDVPRDLLQHVPRRIIDDVLLQHD